MVYWWYTGELLWYTGELLWYTGGILVSYYGILVSYYGILVRYWYTGEFVSKCSNVIEQYINFCLRICSILHVVMS